MHDPPCDRARPCTADSGDLLAAAGPARRDRRRAVERDATSTSCSNRYWSPPRSITNADGGTLYRMHGRTRAQVRDHAQRHARHRDGRNERRADSVPSGESVRRRQASRCTRMVAAYAVHHDCRSTSPTRTPKKASTSPAPSIRQEDRLSLADRSSRSRSRTTRTRSSAFCSSSMPRTA